MKSYQIRVSITIVPCEAAPGIEPEQRSDGSFSITIPESDATSIDRCERALLQTTFPALRHSLSAHLSEMSHQDALAHMTEGTPVPNSVPYTVDGEIGRFEFETHRIVDADTTLYDTSLALFAPLRYWERYLTSGFKELAFIYGATEESYRKTSELINRTRYQPDDGTPSRTICEQAEREGTQVIQAIDQVARQLLTTHQFREDGVFDGTSTAYQEQPFTPLPDTQVAEAMAVCQAQAPVPCDLRENPVSYEAPDHTVNITIDDVGPKRQKATRSQRGQAAEKEIGASSTDPSIKETSAKPAGKTTRKYVRTTIVHVEHANQRYCLAGHGIKYVLSLVVAFLLNNDLLHCRLQFFTDGYTILHDAIRWCFSWYPNLAIILDWHHLEEKCKRQLSLAMTGRVMRNETVEEVRALLWYGLVDQAMARVMQIPPAQIKDPEAMSTLLGYFERNRENIPCYAVRKALGLRNSSQIGERMNGLLVSERQKHNGMSWSVSGSVALASLTTLARNNEHARWFHEGTIEFKLAA